MTDERHSMAEEGRAAAVGTNEAGEDPRWKHLDRFQVFFFFGGGIISKLFLSRLIFFFPDPCDRDSALGRFAGASPDREECRRCATAGSAASPANGEDAGSGRRTNGKVIEVVDSFLLSTSLRVGLVGVLNFFFSEAFWDPTRTSRNWLNWQTQRPCPAAQAPGHCGAVVQWSTSQPMLRDLANLQRLSRTR